MNNDSNTAIMMATSSSVIRAQAPQMWYSLSKSYRCGALHEGFWRFAQLPAELRRKIWGYIADISRDVGVRFNNHPGECQFVATATCDFSDRYYRRHFLPVSLQICQESRADTTKKYVSFFTKSDDGNGHLHIYINPRVDTLFIHAPHWFTLCQKDLCLVPDEATIPTLWKTLKVSAGIAHIADRRGVRCIVVIKHLDEHEDDGHEGDDVATNLERIGLLNMPASFETMTGNDFVFQVKSDFQRLIGWDRAWVQDG